jgi:hypothetical protein
MNQTQVTSWVDILFNYLSYHPYLMMELVTSFIFISELVLKPSFGTFRTFYLILYDFMIIINRFRDISINQMWNF